MLVATIEALERGNGSTSGEDETSESGKHANNEGAAVNENDELADE